MNHLRVCAVHPQRLWNMTTLWSLKTVLFFCNTCPQSADAPLWHFAFHTRGRTEAILTAHNISSDKNHNIRSCTINRRVITEDAHGLSRGAYPLVQQVVADLPLPRGGKPCPLLAQAAQFIMNR